MDAHHMMGNGYMAHGFCFLWQKPLVVLHVASDIVTGLAYYSIPVAMFYFAYRRRDLPFFKIFILFALFILACGTTHFYAAYTIFNPVYWQEGFVKAFTAAVSALTAVLFIPRIPEAIAYPTVVSTLQKVNNLNRELNLKNAVLRMANFSIEKIYDPIYWIAEDARILRVNEAACKILGYTREQLVTLSVADVDPHFPPDRWPDHWRELKEKGTLTFETQHRDKDGRLLDVEVSTNYLRFEGEDFCCAVVRDITERKQAEQERTKLESQLLQAQKMELVGRLAGGVAHDFNNMLLVILGHAGIALDRTDPADPVHLNLTEIRKAAERSAELTRQLLAFARKQTIVPAVLDLNEVLAGMLNLLQRLLGENIQLIWQPAADRLLVKADPSQINQILTNLCVNARDAISDVGRIIIETGSRSFDADHCADYLDCLPGNYVMLAVSDNGCGMDKETLAKVFEPFFTTKGLGAGTGLGLSTVYGIVKQNNGFINAYSEPGQGTSFRIYLPRHEGDDGQAPAAVAATEVPHGQETVLLVEDEPAVLQLTRGMLEKLGYLVLAAGSPGEAISLAREHPDGIHLLMTDMIMPEMNGRDLAKKLLSAQPHLKILFMSGYTAPVTAQHGVLDQGVHFIQKPFSIQDLAEKLREALDG